MVAGGFHPTGLSQGTILEIPNIQIRMELDLIRERPPADKKRLVLVAESDDHCRSQTAGTLLVVPLTTGTSVKRSTAMPIPATTGGLSEDSLALVHIVQPVPRRICTSGAIVGQLSLSQLEELRARLADIFGIL